MSEYKFYCPTGNSLANSFRDNDKKSVGGCWAAINHAMIDVG